MLQVRIPMRPISKDRPRFTNGRCYTTERTKLAEQAIAWMAKEEMIKHSMKIFNKPLSVTIEFGFKLPPNMTKAEKEMLKQNKFHHIKRPDIDNLCKTVLDALNGVAYIDDKFIVHLHAMKVFDEEDYIDIKIEEI